MWDRVVHAITAAKGYRTRTLAPLKDQTNVQLQMVASIAHGLRSAQRLWFRDEAKCPGIKLNPPGQIRFVSIWGNPRLLQVFKLVHAFRSTGWLAGRLAGWAGAMTIVDRRR